MLKSFPVTKYEKKKIPLYLRVLSIDYHQEPVQRPKGVGMTQWFLCTQGSGELIIDGLKSYIHKGYGFLITSDKAHSYHGIDGDFIVNVLGFEGKIVPRLLAILGMTESGVYHFSDPDNFLDHLKKIERLTHQKTSDIKLLYSCEIYATLLSLSENISRVTDSYKASSNQLVEAILNYLETYYYRDISLDELALETGRTPEYLCSIFKKETGQTIIHFLSSIRIAKSRLLLGTYPEKSVAEIGRMCGFQSPSYFGKIFQRHCGMTPNEYRSKNV